MVTASRKLLLPIRVPELGPHLGKLVAATGRRPGGLPLDAVRHQLATRVMEAAGEARRLAARDERDAALEAVGRAAWLAAWEEAAGSTTDMIVSQVRTHLDAEARAVRMPVRRRERLLPAPTYERALRARLGSTGAALVPALDALAAASERARVATARERDAVEAWQHALTTCARQLEAAWLALEEAVAQELMAWERVADRVALWRRSLWPVFAVGIVLAALSVWLGLVLGGYLAAPSWFTEVWNKVVR